jgi:hypothetical protein
VEAEQRRDEKYILTSNHENKFVILSPYWARPCLKYTPLPKRQTADISKRQNLWGSLDWLDDCDTSRRDTLTQNLQEVRVIIIGNLFGICRTNICLQYISKLLNVVSILPRYVYGCSDCIYIMKKSVTIYIIGNLGRCSVVEKNYNYTVTSTSVWTGATTTDNDFFRCGKQKTKGAGPRSELKEPRANIQLRCITHHNSKQARGI